jgi:crossover junction endodeoxyribonuclease RusA
MISFDVIGLPFPQGSKAAFNAKNGKAMMREAGGKNHAAWRNAVSEKAREVAAEHGKLDGPLTLLCVFHFPMPKSRNKAIQAVGRCPKTTAPDGDKLLRAIGDALQAAGLVADDARFYDTRAIKWETTDWTGATITIGTA